MGQPNASVNVTPGSGAVVAAHTIGAKKYLGAVRTDALGFLSDDPVGIYCVMDQVIASFQPVSLLSLLNADPALIVDVLAAFAMVDSAGETLATPVRARLRRISAHSGGTLVTPEKLDTTTSNLDPDITIRNFATSVTPQGEEFSVAIPYYVNSGTGTQVAYDKTTLWNWRRDGHGVPIVCRQNEGVYIIAPDIGTAPNGWYGFLFRVR